jgi:hypothetical protein
MAYSYLLSLSSCVCACYRDAPALSTDQEVSFQQQQLEPEDVVEKEWDDEALAAAQGLANVTTHYHHGGVSSSTTGAANTTAELGTLQTAGMNAASDNIAEKLRVQETKKQLAAAREGMERQAELVRQAKEKQQEQAASAAGTTGTNRFGAAAAGAFGGGGGTGTKWLPPHMRCGGAGTVSGAGVGMGSLRSRMTGGGSQKLDVADNELFPDLAAAEKILEASKPRKGPAVKAPKKSTPGGATWATKTTAKTEAAATATKEEATASKEEVAEPAKVEAVAAAEPQQSPNKEATEPLAASEGTAAAVAPVKKVPTKKKTKKDLSTFKAAA